MCINCFRFCILGDQIEFKRFLLDIGYLSFSVSQSICPTLVSLSLMSANHELDDILMPTQIHNDRERKKVVGNYDNSISGKQN